MNNRAVYSLLCSLLMMLLGACASEAPQHSSYLLRSDKALTSRQLMAAPEIYLGTCAVASYIDQPGLVLAQSDNRIHVARYHQWAEPLRLSLRRFLVAELSMQLRQDVAAYQPLSTVSTASRSDTRTDTGSASRRIDITIDQLHGGSDGAVVLVAYWRVTTGGDTGSSSSDPDAVSVTMHQFAETHALESDGYDALVAAQIRLLEKLAAAVAASLASA